MSIDEQVKLVQGMIIGVVVSTIVAFAVFANVPYIIKQQAIERGYALHCPINGEFAWKGECDDKR